MVPVTVKFRGLGVVAESPLSVTLLVWPGAMVAGLEVHVAPVLQAIVIWLVKPLGAEAFTVKVVEVVPITTLGGGTVTANEKTAVPVPVSDTL